MGNWENDNRNSGDNVNGRPLNNGNGSNPSPDNNNNRNGQGYGGYNPQGNAGGNGYNGGYGNNGGNGYNSGNRGYNGMPNGPQGGPNGYGPGNYNNYNNYNNGPGNNRNNNGNRGGGRNNNNEKKPKNWNTIILLTIACVVTFIGITFLNGMLKNATYKEISYSEFLNMIDENKISKVKFEQDRIIITPSDDTIEDTAMGKIKYTYYTAYINDDELVQTLKEHSDITITGYIPDSSSSVIDFLLVYVLPLLLMIFLFSFIYRKIAKGSGMMGGMGVGKNTAKVYVQKKTGVTFKDVAGQDEAKESLTEIVDFLHNPDKYARIGAKLPKGALLVGPPGTGKTLLAKAVAGEANVPFFSLAGSDFVEMFVGVGASRVRDLFKEAQKLAPCIIFIDEIDAIGKSRDSRYGSGNDEREQTLNQLLAEMDGFDSSKGIFILAATNRPEVLDKALLRPGRLDRRITVDRPDKKGRIETLKVHSKDVLMDDTVDFDEIAMATSGLVGSDLANIINEAAIAAVKNGRNVVTQKDLLGAFDTVVAGKEKKERVLSKKEKQVVAYHEIGHALIRAIKNNSDPVQKITIIPHTNGSLGYVLNFPEEEKHLETKDELMTDLISLVGGRAAEEVVFGSVTNGAYDDIKKATNLAKTMITRYGMSDRFGLVALSTVEDEYLSGRASMNCAQATEAEVDDEVKKLIASCYEEAKQIIRENREVMDQLARYLYDHETITGKEFMKIFREAKGIPEPVDTSLFSTSEKVAESVTFNEDGSYSSTVSGEPESDIWKNIGSHSDDNESDDTAKEKEDD